MTQRTRKLPRRKKPAPLPASDPNILVVGLDWADDKHDLTIFDGCKNPLHRQIDSLPDAVNEIIVQLQKVAAGREIHFAIEKGRNRVIYQLMLRENVVLYLIDPKQASRFKEGFSSSAAKADPTDSYYLGRMLLERKDCLRAFKPDDQPTRKIALFNETRRSLVDDKTRVIQQLTSKIKMYHTVALMLPGKSLNNALTREFLRRFPDPRQARKANVKTLRSLLSRHRIVNPEQVQEIISMIRKTALVTTDAALIEPLAIHVRVLVKQLEDLDAAIEQCESELAAAMNRHQDAHLFRPLPGAGAAMAPRLLTAYGSDRERYESADALGCVVGINPVTRQSGKQKSVTRRWTCPKFLLQTFHEFANCARRYSTWSRAYYEWQRSKGVEHHAAVRKLATRWNRILFSVWKTRTPYDESKYIESMKSKNHPLVAFL